MDDAGLVESDYVRRAAYDALAQENAALRERVQALKRERDAPPQPRTVAPSARPADQQTAAQSPASSVSSPLSPGSALRQKKHPRKATFAPTATTPWAPPPPPAVDTAPGPEPGTRFLDDGTTWIVYRREGRRMVTALSGKKQRRVFKELDCVYYYAATETVPTEATYRERCEYSGIAEVRQWIARTVVAAAGPDPFPVRPAAAAPHSRDAAAAAAAAARPRHAGPAVVVGLAVVAPTDPGIAPCRGTVETRSAAGIFQIAWDDGSRSDCLEADARRMLAAT